MICQKNNNLGGNVTIEKRKAKGAWVITVKKDVEEKAKPDSRNQQNEQKDGKPKGGGK